MLADVDYFITIPDGTKAILEIKTTNYNAKDLWWKDDRETVPAYYKAQGRHYMAVMDIDHVFFCCLYGNTEDETASRIARMLAEERPLMKDISAVIETVRAKQGLKTSGKQESAVRTALTGQLEEMDVSAVSGSAF